MKRVAADVDNFCYELPRLSLGLVCRVKGTPADADDVR